MKIFVSASRANLNNAFDSLALKHAERASRNPRSRETLVYLDPKEFLKLAKQLRSHDATKHDTVKGLLDRGEAFDSLPHLKTELVNGREFKVVGHEGRHRSMYLLKQYPNKLMPVKLIDSTERWVEDGFAGEEITLEAQDSKYKAKVKLP